jgi:hypothetical protein
MNARLYDPALGRFLSPDPYINSLENSQAFNRYLYAMNNPLRYTDPSGEWIITAICAIVGAYLGGALANNNDFNPSKWKYNKFSTYMGIVGGGVVGGCIGAGIESGTLTLDLAISSPYGTWGVGGLGVAATPFLFRERRDSSRETTEYSKKELDNKVSAIYDDAVNAMKAGAAQANDLYGYVNSATNGVRKYVSGEIRYVSESFHNTIKPLGRAITAFELALANTPYETGEIVARNVGYNVGTKIGGYVGGTIGEGIALWSEAGIPYSPYFATVGYGLGSYFGGSLGEQLGLNAYKIAYHSYQIYRYMSQYSNLNDPMILLQYEQNNNSTYNPFY